MSAAILALVFCLAWALTGLILRLARRRHWLDEPNRRSSHSQPTPTLGGVAILAATVLGGWLWPLPTAILYPLTAAAAVLLLLIIDDVGQPLSVSRKAGIQLAAAGAWLAVAPSLTIAVPLLGQIDGPAAYLLAIIWLVGWMNVFNFMDGIDAICASQTLVAGVSMALMLYVVGGWLWAMPAMLAAAAAGFLVFNLPPARLFMGDVGSTFLGLCFGAIVLQATATESALGLVALPLAGYLYDTGLTIMRRAAHGDNVFVAHRQHLYQRLVRHGWSHGRVALSTAIIAAVFGVAGGNLLDGRTIPGLLLALLAGALLIGGSIYTWRDDDV